MGPLPTLGQTSVYCSASAPPWPAHLRITGRTGAHQHRGGGARHAVHALGYRRPDGSHGHPLGQPDPFEGRVDGRQQVCPGAAILLGDAPADTVHPARERRVRVAHQGDHGCVAPSEAADVGLTEIGVHPEAVDIHQRQRRLVGHRLAAQAQVAGWSHSRPPRP